MRHFAAIALRASEAALLASLDRAVRLLRKFAAAIEPRRVPCGFCSYFRRRVRWHLAANRGCPECRGRGTVPRWRP